MASRSRKRRSRSNGNIPTRRQYVIGGRSLGVKVDSVAGLVARIRAGLPYASVQKFQKSAQMTIDELTDIVGIPKRTLSRRRKMGKLSMQQSDRLVRASKLFEQAVSLFDGDVSSARHWLQAPQRALGGESPLSFAKTETGAREVEDLIGRLEYGVYT